MACNTFSFIELANAIITIQEYFWYVSKNNTNDHTTHNKSLLEENMWAK